MQFIVFVFWSMPNVAGRLFMKSCRNNEIFVAPSGARSLVSANSAISAPTRKAVGSGVFARLRQFQNKVARPFAREAIEATVAKLRECGYRDSEIMPAVRGNFPDYKFLLQHGFRFSDL